MNNQNPSLIDQRILNKLIKSSNSSKINTLNRIQNIKYDQKINTGGAKNTYDKDLFFIFLDFIKKNIGILLIIIFLLVILYQRYQDVKKRKQERVDSFSLFSQVE